MKKGVEGARGIPVAPPAGYVLALSAEPRGRKVFDYRTEGGTGTPCTTLTCRERLVPRCEEFI